jgi:peptidoglycan hydrolase-like protein with peptidoglycan-binding domain
MHTSAGESRRSWYTFSMSLRKKIAIALAVPLIVGALFSVSYAQANTSLQAELNALLAQLAALQAQLQVSSPAPTTPVPGGGVGQCPNLVRALRPGISGPDVAALQTFLAADRALYPEGTVSGYYGGLTQKAVQALQLRHGLVTSGTPDTTGYGAVGPATRSLIATLCAGGSIPSTPSIPAGACVMGNTYIENGKTADFYSTASVQGTDRCSSFMLTRQCINGTFSGNSAYRYTACTVSANSPGACSYNGVVMANGESRAFYRQEGVSLSQSCQGIQRTCVNGVVGGSSDYPYPTCNKVSGPVSCTVDGVVIPDGQSIGFYKRDRVLFGQTCAAFQGTRSCTGGVLGGDSGYQYASCKENAAESCVVVTTVGTTTSTTTVAHGASRSFWSTNSVDYTSSCDAVKLARTCNDGSLSGSSAFKYHTCKVTPEKTCDIDGIVVPGGTKRTFYSARSVASGGCDAIDEERTCSNGTLSGGAGYQYAYCAPTGQRYCVQDSAYVAHNASRTFYTTKTPSFGSSCSQYGQSRKCTDGVLEGAASYAYATCSEPTAASCTIDGITVNHNQSRTFYSRTTPPSGATCAEYSQTRTCIDGTLSGSDSFDETSCSNSTSSLGGSQVAAALSALEAILKAALGKLDSWF